MRAIFTILRHSKNSKFRTFATIFSVIIATIILLSTLSIGQAYILRLEKTNLVSALFSDKNSGNDFLNSEEKSAIILTSFSSEFNSEEIREFGMRTLEAKNLPRELQENPAENELWVTPALKNLIDKNSDLRRSCEDFQIREKFPQEFATSPDSLALIFRISDAALENPDARLRGLSSEQISRIYENQKIQNSEQFALVRSITIFIGVLLITPLIILVAEAAKIGIIQREKKFATLNLAGATLGQIRALIILESVPSAIFGFLIGLAIFAWPITIFLTNYQVVGEIFWKSDLKLSTTILAGTAFTIAITMIFANFQALSKIRISPLFVSRASGVRKRPSVFMILPLVLGIFGLIFLAENSQDWYSQNIDSGALILAGLLLVIIVGIMFSGPFLIYVSAKIFSKISRSGAGEIASYRLQNNSRGAFRSVSGIVIALFVGAFFATFITTSQVEESAHANRPDGTLSAFEKPLQITVHTPYLTDFDNSLLVNLSSSKELQKITGEFYTQKSFTAADFSSNLSGGYYESCEELAMKTRLTCPERITEPIVASMQIMPDSHESIQPEITSVRGISGEIHDSGFIFIAKTNADFASARNEIETIARKFQRETGNPVSIEPDYSTTNSLKKQAENSSAIVGAILTITLLTGGLSIFVGTVGGIFERRRFFTQLKILGAKPSTAALSLIAEAAIPLLIISFFAICLGIFCCWSMLRIVIGSSAKTVLPSPQFWLLIIFVLVFAILLTTLTLPLVKNMMKENIHSE